MASYFRYYLDEQKEDILKIIKEGEFPLKWIDERDGGGQVAPIDGEDEDGQDKLFDFSEFDKKVLALDPEPPPFTIVSTVVSVVETPLSQEIPADMLDRMKHHEDYQRKEME